MTEVLLGIAIALLVALLAVTLSRRGNVEAAVSNSWVRLGLAERVAAVEVHARAVSESYRAFEQLLRVPTARGALGELALDTILSDQLPPEMYGLRQRAFDGKVPDGAIRSTVGLICIDAKFPLDNYRALLQAPSPQEAEASRRRFLRDVQRHLSKVGDDYVRPEKGSAEFAFAYLPSESVYYYLVTEAYELLAGYARRGVQVVSPLTLCTKVELIKAGVLAQRLGENAQQVRDDLRALAERFSAVEAQWQVLYGTHLRNALAKADEVDRAYAELRREFEQVASVGGEPVKGGWVR